MDHESMQILERLYTQVGGVLPVKITPLERGGSIRKRFRLNGTNTDTGKQLSLIGVMHDREFENQAFVDWSHHFARFGLRVPQVVAFEKTAYLEEDLGDVTLSDALQRCVTRAEYVQWLIYALQLLPHFQIRAGRSLDFSKCFNVYELPEYQYASISDSLRANTIEYNAEAVMWNVGYFEHFFLKANGIPYDQAQWFRDAEHLAAQIDRQPREFFLHRDYQVRNIMVDPAVTQPALSALTVIDFQTGKRGGLAHDLAVFITQPVLALSSEEEQQLMQAYLKEAQELAEVDGDELLQHLEFSKVIVTLQRMAFSGKVLKSGNQTEYNRRMAVLTPWLQRWASQSSALHELPEMLRVVREICGRSCLP